jgi:hypothetical protein
VDTGKQKMKYSSEKGIYFLIFKKLAILLEKIEIKANSSYKL